MDDRYFRNWALLITGGFLFCFGAIGVKLCVEHTKVPDIKVDEKREFDYNLEALRGKIYDRNGQQNPMAMSLFTRLYFVDPHINSTRTCHRTNLVPMVSLLADTLQVERDELWYKYQTISPESYQALLYNNPDDQLWSKYRSHNRRNVIALSDSEEVYSVITNKTLISGVGIKNKVVRTYPGRRRMSHVLGFVNNMGVGSAGVEQCYDSYLRGVQGRIEGQKDARGRIISYRRSILVDPINGSDLYLTLDSNIQHIVEKTLSGVVQKFSAAGGWAIVEKIKTGEIMAMASFPDFEPEFYNNVNSNIWANKAVSVNYEPGSAMKPIIACAALNHGVIDEHQKLDVGLSKIWFYAGRPLRDHVTGMVDLRKALVKSSNIYFAKLGLMMGNECIYRYLRAFNFGTKLGVDLPGEQFGIVRQPQKWDSLTPTRVPIGQGVAVTALQLINAFACIANDGVLMKPYVVDKIVSPNGEVVFKNKPTIIGRPVRRDVAALVREMMIGITKSGGTGKSAAVAGYTVAGKTGTAQKPVDGIYSQTDYYATFVGFIPAVNPEVAILVTVDTPKPQHTGGYVSGPAFAEITSALVRYLEIPPDDFVEEEL